MRSCDEPVTAGDNAKFRSRCAWAPKIRLATTLHDMLEWWRARLAGVVLPGPRAESARTHNLGR